MKSAGVHVAFDVNIASRYKDLLTSDESTSIAKSVEERCKKFQGSLIAALDYWVVDLAKEPTKISRDISLKDILVCVERYGEQR